MNSDTMAEKRSKETIYDALYQLLVQETALYEQLTDVLKEKQHALISNDLIQINSLTLDEQKLLKKSNRLSQTRQAMINDLFGDWGVEQAKLTLRDLMKYSGKSTNPDWARLEKKMKLTLKQVKNLNNENQVLVGTALQFLKDLVQITLNDDCKTQQTYGDDGTINPNSKTQKLLDYQI